MTRIFWKALAKSSAVGVAVALLWWAFCVIVDRPVSGSELAAEVILMGLIVAISMAFPFVFFGAENDRKNR